MNTLLTELCSHLDLEPEHTELLNERDTSDIWRQFAIWLLVDSDDGVLRFTNLGSLQYKAINRVADLYIQDCKDADAWKEAYVAASVAASVANSAAEAVASYVAKAATYAPAATYAVTTAAKSAFYDAYAAHSYAVAAATTDAHCRRMANKLIELLQAAPLKENP